MKISHSKCQNRGSKQISSIHVKLQIKKRGTAISIDTLILWSPFYKKNSTKPLKKVQNMILFQNNIFLSRYMVSQPMFALLYFTQVTVILMCSLNTLLLQEQNVDFTFRTRNAIHIIIFAMLRL